MSQFRSSLNPAVPGDPLDTTSPAAMLANLDALVPGNARPPGRAPILVAVYLTDTTKSADQRNAIHGAVGCAVAAAVR